MRGLGGPVLGPFFSSHAFVELFTNYIRGTGVTHRQTDTSQPDPVLDHVGTATVAIPGIRGLQT